MPSDERTGSAKMNLKATLFVVSAGITLLISILGEIRNHWFWDKRKNSYRYVTRTILALWVLLAPFAVGTAYLQIGQVEKKPEWRVWINGLQMPLNKKDCSIAICSTNNVWTLQIGAKNTGDATADRVKVDFVYNAAWTNAVEIQGHWTQEPAGHDESGRFVSNDNVRHCMIVSGFPVGPQSTFDCPPFVFRQQTTQPIVFRIGICIASVGAKSVLANYDVHFRTGLGDPHLE